MEKIQNSPKLGFQFKTLENRGHGGTCNCSPLIQCIFYIFERIKKEGLGVYGQGGMGFEFKNG